MRSQTCLLALLLAGCSGNSKGSIDAAPPSDTAIVDDAESPIDLATRVRACSVAGACQLVEDLEQCVFLLDAYAPASRIACLANATVADCDAARACFGYRLSTDPACVPGCADADTYVRCVDGLRAETDCPASIYQLGAACITNGRSDCGGAACADAGTATCVGTVSRSCDSGITEETDCADRGLSCNPATGRCAGAASGTCTPDTPATCDGDAIVTCDASGVLRRQDCSVMGRTCVDGESTKICGYGAACPADELPTCTGTVLAACIDGVRESIDCATIGATQCVDSGTSMARCAP